MSINDLSDPRSRRARGMSMDMGSPYILPRELNGSRASLHSMSRSLREENDPYRPVTMVRNDWESARGPRQPHGNGSIYSAAGSMQSGVTNEKAGLIRHASPMSLSHPRRGDSASPNPSRPSEDFQRPLKSADRKPIPARKDSPAVEEKSLPPITVSRAVSPAQTSTLGDFVPPPPPPPPKDEPEVVRPPRSSSISQGSVKRPVRKDSIAKHPVPAVVEPFPDDLPAHSAIDTSFDHENFSLPPPPPPPPEPSYDEMTLAMPQPHNARMSILGLRPLPADLPDDNPEVRANRIRSFYREYFDETKPNPAGGYVDDYDADYLADYAIYDHAAGGFLTGNRPYAQPVQRRAMTPPPRGPGYGYGPGPHRRNMSTQSGGMYGPRGRAISAPKKRMPPPQALISLPTPHMLRDDSSIFSATKFAPPTTFRDRQAGRAPDSPLGTSRPYSPAVMAHNPLAKSYDELPAVPSPYLLRKSGTFTSLDFAPPSRLRVDGTASDAGSIRSNRSGISAVQQHAIRGGAYRVSRIPSEMVTTKAALAAQLKPRWDMRNGDNIMG